MNDGTTKRTQIHNNKTQTQKHKRPTKLIPKPVVDKEKVVDSTDEEDDGHASDSGNHTTSMAEQHPVNHEESSDEDDYVVIVRHDQAARVEAPTVVSQENMQGNLDTYHKAVPYRTT